MPSLTVSEVSSKPYVSRRKRQRRRQNTKTKHKLRDLLTTRSVLGLLGLILLTVLVCLGVIVFQMDNNPLVDRRLQTASAN